jgi:endonuclease/exonuclease/phosphatase family metal-dependent hydrolase
MRQHSYVRLALIVSAFTLLAGIRPSAAGEDIVLYARNATARAGAWSVVSDSSAAGGARMANPDAGAAKIENASGSPASYFELQFTVTPGIPYHLWIRSKAQNDYWTNDSAFVQFSGSVNQSGSAIYRIGSSAAAVYSLEKTNGAGESGWGWQDNDYGQFGDPIYFSGTSQRIRIQVREDGLSIDQIVLSPSTYLTSPPGSAKNDATILPENTGGGSGSSTTQSSGSTTTSGAVAWTNVVNAQASGATITKTSGCYGCYDGGGVSNQQLSSGTASFSVTTGEQLAVGLDHAPSASSLALDYAFQFSGNAWEVRENGGYRTDGSFSPSDVFSIGVSGSTVKYYRNGAVVYTSKTPPSSALTLAAALGTVGAKVSNASISGSTTSSGGGTSGGGSTSTPPPPPPPPPTSSSTLRVLQWNTHHGGYGTDNVYDPNRLATWAASFKPDVVMFNEIEKYTGWGNQDQPEVYKKLLEQKTGQTWYYIFAQEFGAWSSNGKGNMILSRFPLRITDRYELVHNADRSIAMATITVNNRDITLICTHLDPDSQTLRLTQAKEVTGWSASQPENRIITGDMNAWPDQSSISHFNSLYYDSWTVAASKGAASAFSGNNGETKKGRIDYIFYSRGSSNLTVQSSQVYDTRDSRGVMPSDHRPVLTTFVVK